MVVKREIGRVRELGDRRFEMVENKSVTKNWREVKGE